EPNALVHEADVAVYQAKLKGRNCVVQAADVPHYVKLDSSPAHDRLDAPYTAAFAPRPESVNAPAGAPLSPETSAELKVLSAETGPELEVLSAEYEPQEPELRSNNSTQHSALSTVEDNADSAS